MTKYITLYEIREYVENQLSTSVGSKLRSKARVNRILKRLKRQNREFCVLPWKVKMFKPKPKSTYQFETKQIEIAE